jgi:endo-1,4-beta-xylanase
VKINGVGFQAHLASEMTKRGVDVAYTEIDVRMNTPPTQAKLKVQADTYERIAASCLAVPRCVGMTTWVSKAAASRIVSTHADVDCRAFLTSIRGFLV